MTRPTSAARSEPAGGCPMLPVLELHLTGQSTPEAQAALAAHVPTCAECLAATQAIADQPPTIDDLPPDELPTPPDGVPALGAQAAPAAPARDEEPGLIPGPVRALLELVIFGALGIVVAIGTLVMPDPFAPPPVTTERTVAPGIVVSEVRMSRVLPDGRRAPLQGPAVIGPKDRLGFSYLHTSNWERLMIFVVDEKGEIYWQIPEWTDRRSPAFAPTILSDRELQVLPVATHRDWAGTTLSVHAVFLNDFVTAQEVEDRLLDPERDRSKPLFERALERVILVNVDPTADAVVPATQDETDQPPPREAIDKHLKLEPIR